jgi:D-sedoheptulose 7-phosphate isomerase
MSARAARSLNDALEALRTFAAEASSAGEIARIAATLASCIRAGGKILICGNGGSSADAMHFAEELTGRFRADRPAMPAIACVDVGHITCTANDYGFDKVFSRWVEGLGRPGDVLVVLSTSGNSSNIVEAIKSAKHRGLTTVALLGKGGGKLRGACAHEIVAPGATSDRIQEIHMLVLHILVEVLEAEMGYVK